MAVGRKLFVVILQVIALSFAGTELLPGYIWCNNELHLTN